MTVPGIDSHCRWNEWCASISPMGEAMAKRAKDNPKKAPSGSKKARTARSIAEVTALDIDLAEPFDDDIATYFAKCEEKLGLIPNVLTAYAFDQDKLRAFSAFYNDLMLAPSGLSKLEREMIAVVVSSINRCFYCQTAHGAAVRAYSGDPVLGELMVQNYREAKLDKRQRAMLDFSAKLTETPAKVGEEDRAVLRKVGFTDRDIWDIAAVVGFFNMSNRVATATAMQPNAEYHGQAR